MNEEEKPEMKVNKPTTQNDVLATSRTDLVSEQDEDENAENGTLGWMNHELKFVKHFEVSETCENEMRTTCEMVHLSLMLICM